MLIKFHFLTWKGKTGSITWPIWVANLKKKRLHELCVAIYFAYTRRWKSDCTRRFFVLHLLCKHSLLNCPNYSKEIQFFQETSRRNCHFMRIFVQLFVSGVLKETCRPLRNAARRWNVLLCPTRNWIKNLLGKENVIPLLNFRVTSSIKLSKRRHNSINYLRYFNYLSLTHKKEFVWGEGFNFIINILKNWPLFKICQYYWLHSVLKLQHDVFTKLTNR